MPLSTEQAVEVRKLVYEKLTEEHRAVFALTNEYGKWLTASLLLLHGGTFAYLVKVDTGAPVTPVSPVAIWSVAGLCMALLCGTTV